MKRFHLSTLLLVTVLAGAFVGANVAVEFHGGNYCWGWPLYTEEQYYPDTTDLIVSAIFNLIPCGIVLALAGYVSEQIARRQPRDLLRILRTQRDAAALDMQTHIPD